jgi:hypothetical protein
MQEVLREIKRLDRELASIDKNIAGIDNALNRNTGPFVKLLHTLNINQEDINLALEDMIAERYDIVKALSKLIVIEER